MRVRLTCRPASRVLQSSAGFTLVEMTLALFLIAVMFALVLPRLGFGESLPAAGRQLIGTIRAVQGLAMSGQRTVRLYLELGKGTYWPMVLDGQEEKPPRDTRFAIPLMLPEDIRFLDVTLPDGKRESGRAEIVFYPSGRIDAAIVHLADRENTLLAIKIDPLTGAIKLADQREDPQRRLQPIAERYRVLLGTTTTATAAPSRGRF